MYHYTHRIVVTPYRHTPNTVYIYRVCFLKDMASVLMVCGHCLKKDTTVLSFDVSIYLSVKSFSFQDGGCFILNWNPPLRLFEQYSFKLSRLILSITWGFESEIVSLRVVPSLKRGLGGA